MFEELSRVLRYYQQGRTDNPYLKAYIEEVGSGNETYRQFVDVLSMINDPEASYYICLYHAYLRDDMFEDLAIAYVETHEFDRKAQTVLYDLLSYYMFSDFEKPERWVRMIMERENVALELYRLAATYYSLVGEYDLADKAISKAIEMLGQNQIEKRMLFGFPESEKEKFDKLSGKIKKYRVGRPYWPSDLERRKKIIAVYDKKGIQHPPFEKTRDVKEATAVRTHYGHTKESDFEPITEYVGDKISDYCSFWCNEAFALHNHKDIYEIAAIRVRGDKIISRFQRFIRPWSAGSVAKRDVARKLEISEDDVEKLEGVYDVIKDFFDFVGKDILLSTDALGKQKDLLSRAARYADMTRISSQFLDLLDYAADVNSNYDMKNYNREFLISHFSLEDDGDAMVKAENNVKVYNALKKEAQK